MTIAIMKTKAEQELARQFSESLARLPGGSAVADLRRKAFAVFEAQGLPHRRVEEWKYTDLRAALGEAMPLVERATAKVDPAVLEAALGPLAALDATRLVLLDGVFHHDLSGTTAGTGVGITSLREMLAADDRMAPAVIGAAVPGTDSIIALNTALVADGLTIELAANPARPLLVVHARADTLPRNVVTRVVVTVRPGVEATLIEAFVALPGAAIGQANAAVGVAVGEGARLDHVQLVFGAGTHLSSTAPTLAGAATYRLFQMTAASSLVRNQTFPIFEGVGGKLDVSGLALGRGSEHVDTTLVVDHAVPGCESREHFKAVLADKAKGVFQGKVIVRPDAQKTDGKQMAQALMLSPDAEFDAKPELEIYADDVVCGHGATVAELDEDMIFYCRARGIPKSEAQALLVESFAAEALEKIEHEGIREAFASIARAWLGRQG
jgi:Fe-S cluster assembly protein SufD